MLNSVGHSAVAVGGIAACFVSAQPQPIHWSGFGVSVRRNVGVGANERISVQDFRSGRRCIWLCAAGWLAPMGLAGFFTCVVGGYCTEVCGGSTASDQGCRCMRGCSPVNQNGDRCSGPRNCVAGSRGRPVNRHQLLAVCHGPGVDGGRSCILWRQSLWQEKAGADYQPGKKLGRCIDWLDCCTVSGCHLDVV